MTLEEAKINQEYIINEINIDKCTKSRLEVLGVLKGTKIKILNKRSNGAIIVKIRGTRLGLDKEVAQAINIDEKDKGIVFNCRGEHCSSVKKDSCNMFKKEV